MLHIAVAVSSRAKPCSSRPAKQQQPNTKKRVGRMMIYAGEVAPRARGGDCDWEGLGGEGTRTSTSWEGGKGVPSRLGGPYAGHACMGCGR